MRRSDQPREYTPQKRTSQIIFGERQHLRAVLDSIHKFKRKDDRLDREKNQLQELIDSRTAELNHINRNWDRNFDLARSPNTAADELARLAQAAPAEDYLLLRTIAEHPNTPASVLAVLGTHVYDAIKENVARHPNADAATLEKLAAESARPLWFLVACNPAAPATLREKLRARMELGTSAGN